MDIKVNGRHVHASTGGRETRKGEPTVVLIHGNGLDHTIWQLQTRHIANRSRRAIAVDLPGHGKSEGPPLQSIIDMSDWLLQFLDAAGIFQVTLVGHSMGAFVSLEAAARCPDRIEKLALMGIADTMPVHPELLAAAKRNETLAAELIVFWGLGKKAQIGGHPAPGLWVHGAAKTLLSNARSGALYAGLSACHSYKGAVEAATKVKCPALLILGKDDKMAPARKAKLIENSIQNTQTIILEQCGHMMLIERPNQIHQVLMPFLPQKS